MGGIDDFEGIHVLCKKFKLWFHIDACWGGHNYFLPEVYGEKTKGSHLCDSLAIDPHKGLGSSI